MPTKPILSIVMVKNTRNPLRINNPARYVRASRWQNGGAFRGLRNEQVSGRRAPGHRRGRSQNAPVTPQGIGVYFSPDSSYCGGELRAEACASINHPNPEEGRTRKAR